MTVTILAQLEARLGKPCHEIFDLITGISTGSIIAGALATGMPAAKIKDLYQELGPVVFDKPRGFLRWIFQSRYPSDGLEKVLSDNFAMSFNDVKTKLMVYAVRLDGQNGIEPTFWKSWRNDLSAPCMWEAMMASSAAPAYFDTVKIGDHWYTDGGVAAVNPSMYGLAESLRLGCPIEHIRMFNIGTLTPPQVEDPGSFRGLWKVMLNGLAMSLDTGDNLVDYQCRQILGDRFLTCAPAGNDVTVDSQEWTEMTIKAQQVWGLYEQEILTLLEADT